MPVPNPVMPVKGAGTTLWVYKGSGDPYANPLSDVDWSRLAKVKDLTPGELTAESYDDSYLDDEDADWTATGHPSQREAGISGRFLPLSGRGPVRIFIIEITVVIGLSGQFAGRQVFNFSQTRPVNV